MHPDNKIVSFVVITESYRRFHTHFIRGVKVRLFCSPQWQSLAFMTRATECTRHATWMMRHTQMRNMLLVCHVWRNGEVSVHSYGREYIVEWLSLVKRAWESMHTYIFGHPSPAHVDAGKPMRYVPRRISRRRRSDKDNSNGYIWE